MDKYLFLFRGGINSATASPEEIQANMQKWFQWVEKLSQEGIYEGGEALEARDSKMVAEKGSLVTDGPYSEGKELLGGYFLIKARDADHAAEISKEAPNLDYDGTVEVRKIMVFDQ